MNKAKTKQQSLNFLLNLVYPKQTEYLKKIMLSGKLNHAYCFVGDEDGGQEQIMNYFLSEVICENFEDYTQCDSCPNCVENKKGIHPDVLSIKSEKDSKLISIESVHTIRKHLSYRPTLCKKRVVCIQNADRLSTSAMNALLKIVEEPTEFALILMSTSALDKIHSTLRSRMHCIRLPRLSHKKTKEILKKVSNGVVQDLESTVHLVDGRLGRLLEVLETKGGYTKKLEEELGYWMHFLKSGVAERDTMFQQRFFKGENSKKSAQQLNVILEYIEAIFHDMLLNTLRLDASRQFMMHQQAIDSLSNQSSLLKISKTLERMRIIKKMNIQYVSKKMLFDYLIIAL